MALELCSNGLHPVDDLAANGQCQGCKSLQQRRRRWAARGVPLCWTAEHPAPEEGCVCSCGEPPPPASWEDWAAVENVLAGRWVPRRLTAAEELSAMRTIMVRHGGGWFEAATWITEHTAVTLDDRRVKYLLSEWAPRVGHVARSVGELLAQETNQATAPVETAA